jgi:hypothetical protein
MDISIDLFLYGELARYAVPAGGSGYSNTKRALKGHATIRDLLTSLGMPTEKRGVTFINGQLSAMPGVQPDLEHVLADNDRVAFFDLRSMWPFQYRHGAPMVDEMARALSADNDGPHHSYQS